MACDCGERFQMVFKADNRFSVYFDEDRKANPLQWTEGQLCVCIQCGRIDTGVPDAELQILRNGAGDLSL